MECTDSTEGEWKLLNLTRRYDADMGRGEFDCGRVSGNRNRLGLLT